MKTTLCLACAAFAVAVSVSAQTDAKPAGEAAAAPPSAPMDKVSYFIGTNVGGQFKGQGIELDFDSFLQGIKDQYAGNKPKYSREELMAAMQAFEAVMQAKQEESLSPEEKAEIAKKRAERQAKYQEAMAAGTKFLTENGKKPGVKTTASGLQYEVIKEGNGAKPIATDRVNVHYHGTLLSGKVFDSSVERGMPITFGVQDVIKGWTEALQLMSVGSKLKLYIPSDLAYGDNGAGDDIGPGETLVFEVELLAIEK